MELPVSLATASLRRLRTVGKVTVAALAVNACAELFPLCIHFFGDGRLSVPLLVISVLGLLMARLAARGIHRRQLVGGLWSRPRPSFRSRSQRTPLRSRILELMWAIL